MDNQKWDTEISEYSETHTAKVTAVEGAIVLWASQFDYERLPKWGDAGVRAFASVACCELQNMNAEELCSMVISRLGTISKSIDDRNDVISTLTHNADFNVLQEWAKELR